MFLNALYLVLYAFIFERWKNIFKISLYIYCIYKTYMYICISNVAKGFNFFLI